MGIPASLLCSTAGTKDLADFLRMIAIISSADTLTIFDGRWDP